MTIKYLTSDLTKKTSQEEGSNLAKDLTGVKTSQEKDGKEIKNIKKEEKIVN